MTVGQGIRKPRAQVQVGLSFQRHREPTRHVKGLIITTPERSRIMGSVRQRGTEPEWVVRRSLSEIGLRYRLNVRALPGTPDMANVARRFAIFVNGCFWHRHSGCNRATTPKANADFWRRKFEVNVARDIRNTEALSRLGFTVLTVWECETIDRKALRRRLLQGLRVSRRQFNTGKRKRRIC